MRKAILQNVKATFLLAGFSTFMNSAYSQQNIIADKDKTRPDTEIKTSIDATIIFFKATRMDSWNEIQWAALQEEDTKRYILEYSTNGIDYRTAGEVIPLNGEYLLKHPTVDKRSFLYRIRAERNDGKFYNLRVALLEGNDIPAVKIYPTMIEGNTINIDAGLAVERINIYSSDGRQVFVKEMSGFSGTTQIVIPSLSKGMYWMNFYGSGWKSISKFIIGR